MKFRFFLTLVVITVSWLLFGCERTPVIEDQVSFLSFGGSGGWIMSWGCGYETTAEYEMVNDICVDRSGNVIITGDMEESADLNPKEGVAPQIVPRIFATYLSKFDSSGDLIWSRSWTTSGFQIHGENVDIDNSGNIFVSGTFNGKVDFDPGEGVAELKIGEEHMDCALYLCKFNPDGEFQWVRSWEGFWGEDIVVDSGNDVILVGRTPWTADYPMEQLNLGVEPDEDLRSIPLGEDAFLIKVASDGSYRWGHTWGGQGRDNVESVHVDSIDRIVVYGTCSDDIDLDPGPGTRIHDTASGGQYITRFDKNGNFTWTNTDRQLGHPIGFDDRNALYLIEPFGVLNTDGQVALTTIWNPDAVEMAAAVSGGGEIFVAGSYRSNKNFGNRGQDLVLNGNGGTDSFIGALTSEGEVEWMMSLGGKHMDGAKCIAVHRDGSLYIGGFFMDAVNISLGDSSDTLYSNGGSDSFLMKLGGSGAPEPRGPSGVVNGDSSSVDL